MGRGKVRDMEHMRVPACERGALWWMREHAFAEDAVTNASRALDAATDDYTRRTFTRQLDARLDHLEHTEDICYAVIERLRNIGGETVASACEAHYLRGETWACVAARLRRDVSTIYEACERALSKLD